MVLPPGDALRSIVSGVMLAQAFPAATRIAPDAANSREDFHNLVRRIRCRVAGARFSY
jgi:hypothetical protein